MDDIFEQMKKSIDTTQIKKLPKEEHGELISVSYSSSTNGMMFNSNTLNSLSLERMSDHAQLTVKNKASGGGTDVSVYKAELSLFDKLREIIERENVAAWSALRYVELFQMTDYSSSENLTLVFDDRSVGGNSRVWKSIDCKAVDQQGRRDVIIELRSILSAEGRGELISQSSGHVPNMGFMGVTGGGSVPMGMMGIGMMTAMMANSADASGTWLCPSCGENKNKGKFCMECGSPRPSEEKKEKQI